MTIRAQTGEGVEPRDDRLAVPEQSDIWMSDEARQHLRDLVVHRPDYDELRIVLHPKRCAWCRELAVTFLGREGGSSS